MYAIVQTGGKQYTVSPGDTIKVEKLAGEPGERIELDQVLAVGSDSGMTVGKPTVDGARVTAEIVEQAKAKKIIVFTFKRRKGHKRKLGHRQQQTVLKIMDIAS